MSFRTPSKSYVKNRAKPWRVRWGDRDRPSTAFFETEEEADEKISLLFGDLGKFGTEGVLSNSDRLAVLQAKHLLEGRDLLEVLRHGLAGVPPPNPVEDRRLALEDAIDLFHRYNAGQHLRPTTIAFYEQQLKILQEHFPARKLCDISRAELVRMLKNLPGKSGSKKCLRAAVKRLFNWAYRCDPPLLEANPVARDLPLDLPRQDTNVPFLSLAQVKGLLSHADHELRGTLAVQLLTGLRRWELMRMDWSAIDRRGRRIHIRSEESKTRKGDDLEQLPAAFWLWIRAYGKQSGRILCNSYDKRIRKARAAAGIAHWPQSLARHTFATYHYAAYRNASLTASIMRHESGLGIFYRHYKGTGITQAMGREFLSITPKSITDPESH